jgi:hypothetical protein
LFISQRLEQIGIVVFETAFATAVASFCAIMLLLMTTYALFIFYIFSYVLHIIFKWPAQQYYSLISR